MLTLRPLQLSLGREYLFPLGPYDVINRSQALTLSKGRVLMSIHANTDSAHNLCDVYSCLSAGGDI